MPLQKQPLYLSARVKVAFSSKSAFFTNTLPCLFLLLGETLIKSSFSMKLYLANQLQQFNSSVPTGWGTYIFVKQQIMAIFHRKCMQNTIYAFRYSNNSVDPDTRFHFKKIQNHLAGAVSAEFRKHICCGLILINGYRFNEKYLLEKRVPEQKASEMTSQNCNLICYSTLTWPLILL